MARLGVTTDLTRRTVLSSAAASALAAVLLPGMALADPETLQREIWRLMGDKKHLDGRINLETPELAENGAVVPVRISVASPMTENDYVRAIHLLVDENPWPTIASFQFMPGAGKADIRTRVRMARTLHVYAFAELNDGRVFRAIRKVDVTIGGCS